MSDQSHVWPRVASSGLGLVVLPRVAEQQPRVAEVPRVAKLGHAWPYLATRGCVLGLWVRVRVRVRVNAWLRCHAWPSTATRGQARPRVAVC